MKPTTISMGQPIGACDAAGFARKGGFGETRPEIKTPLSTMKATSPSPCSGKAPFTWTNNEAGVHWSPSGEKSHSQSEVSPQRYTDPWFSLALDGLILVSTLAIWEAPKPIPARGIVHPWQNFPLWLLSLWLFGVIQIPALMSSLCPDDLAVFSSLPSFFFHYQHNAAHLAQQSIQVSRPGLAPLSLKQDPVSPSQTTASLSNNYLPGILHSHDSYGSPVQEAPFYTYTAATAPAQYSSSGKR
ncbi:hypothetical protein N7490_003806 [Penicillium lividum]|nr:hypothetical protein N7490_003806 [Penicillium lividum]